MPERKNIDRAAGQRAPDSNVRRKAARGTGSRSPRKAAKPIVQRRQVPWGLILSIVLVAAFAVVVIGYALTRPGSGSASSVPYLNELPAAEKITGITFKPESDRTHRAGAANQGDMPPVGGSHSAVWADCTGTVYPKPIAAENAVHSLEHGAVWITYRPDVPQTQIDALTAMVRGASYTLVSPYPDQQSPIAVQSWGYQLRVDSANDPRLTEFVDTLRSNPRAAPEPGGSCANPAFKTSHGIAG